MSWSKYILFLILLSTFGCGEDEINKPIKSEDTGLLAVEGVLTNENINQHIRLTHPYLTINGEATPATGAIVQISDGSNIYLLTESPIGSGDYYTNPMRAVYGLTYTLVIQYKGNQYIAQDSSVPVEPLLPIDYYAAGDGYELNLYKTGQSSNYIDYSISWKNTSQCTGTDSCEGRVFYYDLKSVDVNEIFKPDKEDFVFPLNSIIIRKKYSTSEAYKNFLRSILSETEWRGGNFDVDRANASTNLSGGAVGFFGVSTVVSDTTIVTQRP